MKEEVAPVREAAGRPAEKFQLRLLFWETTAACNLECIHCRRLDVMKELAKDDLSTEEAFSFIDNLATLGSPILVLSGGEPLYRPDIFEIGRYARSRGLKLALATNGTLVDEPIARQIVDAGVQRVAISFDGADAKTHDEFRKLPGSFDRATEGFKHLKKLGMSMQVNSTIAKHNVHQLRDIYNLAVSLGADALHIFMLVPVGCGVEIAEDMMLSAEKYEESLHLFYDLAREAKIQTKATCAPHYFRIVREKAAELGMPNDPSMTPGGRHSGGGHPGGHPGGGHPGGGHPGSAPGAMAAITRGCLAGTGVCFVSHKGEVFPCGYLPVTSGNVRTENLVDIWHNSKVFARMRNVDLLGGKCGACEYKKICEGCRARAFYETGDYMAEEPYCIYTPKALRKKG
ncbi:MAG: radical SAM protein [Candidatus Brocadiales bacterium]|nr:radical SAM protein [Candidatus Bathyanammoxibius amoris]